MQANTNTLSALVQTYITPHSDIQKARLAHAPPLPSILNCPFRIIPTHTTSAAADVDTIKQLFPLTFGQQAMTFVRNDTEIKHQHHINVGLVLSGGPAPGGHNVISGLFDYLSQHHVAYKAYGFLDGPSGIIDGKYITITEEIVKQYRNAGGFHMIGSGRTKIETPKQFASALATVQKLQLDGLIVVGGDDSNTNAALLAEYFLREKCKTKVIGVPKTIDGDLRNEYIETSFGFDTATKVYSEKIAALADDAVSARKTYHFCRLMGRTASHITLECALQTHPNVALIGEEIKDKKITLNQLVGEIADIICARAARSKHYGIVILPEGLVDFLVDVSELLKELDELIASAGGHPPANVLSHLSEPAAHLFGSLPPAISQQLLLDRDPHGNVQVSKIESERLLAQMVEAELNRRKQKNLYGGSLSIVCHFLGYEGRCGLPSNFDANYCYALGHVAGALLSYGYTGMMAVVSDLTLPVEQWKCGGMPLTHMMNIERRKGHAVPVIRKALVDLSAAPFQIFAAVRDGWKLTDSYRNPGSIQYFGPLANSINLTLAIENQTEQYQRQQSDLKNLIQAKL